MSELIRCERIGKAYRSGGERLEVLADLDLHVERGAMVAVVGESGVGKSTLLHLLGALDRPDAGRYFFGGQDVFSRDASGLAAFRNRNVGFVFQSHHLLPEFTTLENVLMPRLLRRERRSDFEDGARALLDELGLSDRLDHRPAELSGGEQQRVAIARALAAEPDLVLADEPTGNLDPRTSVQVFEALRDAHARRGLTTVLATHNERLSESCDHTLLLADGRLRLLDEAGRRAYYSPGRGPGAGARNPHKSVIT